MSDLLIAVLICWLALWVEHWFPWQLLLRRPLPRLAAYILGVLAIAGPLTGLYWRWMVEPAPWPWAHLVGLWAVIVGSGLATMLAWGIDALVIHVVATRERMELLEQVNQRLEQINGRRQD